MLPANLIEIGDRCPRGALCRELAVIKLDIKEAALSADSHNVRNLPDVSASNIKS
jgi:hypothetical protein